MHELLQQIQDPNTRGRIYLAKLLSARDVEPLTIASPSGLNGWPRAAMFAALDPWMTCWRFPPGSCRFFTVAEKDGLVAPHEAIFLVRMLLHLVAALSKEYRGPFQPFFTDPRVTAMLTHVDELELLSRAGLALSNSGIDRLFEACPWPLQPSKHFAVNSSFDVRIERLVDSYTETPWLRWVESLDVACLGPTLGLTVEEIHRIVSRLNGYAEPLQSSDGKVTARSLAKRVTIPFFSFGLQGLVIGMFRDIPQEEEKYVMSALTQFGQALADQFALLRINRFRQRFRADMSNQELARELLCIFSPVSKLAVERYDKKYGYKLLREHNYLAGYEEMSSEELSATGTDGRGFYVDLPPSGRVYVEAMPEIFSFHEDFVRMRMESCFGCVGIQAGHQSSSARLPLHHVQELRASLSVNFDGEAPSIAKLRQYFVATKVEEHWLRGRVRVTNSHVKEFLEAKLNKKIKGGYQISSFAADIERLFHSKITISKSRDGLTLSWNEAE